MNCKMVRSNGGGSCGRRFVASPEDLPYIVWDSTVNPNDEYGPAPSLHSHPASIITYNHIPPMINSCQASSTLSWDSSTFSRRCCSPACCAILLTAILILAALLTVIGVAVYLGIITNLSKATILPVSGRFRVISGDDFVPSLYNTSSKSFIEKAEKYNAIIHSAFQWTSIDSSIIKSEVYAFRKGSLIVHFRVYLDRKKILQARNALAFGRNVNIESRSSSSSSSTSSSRNDNLIAHLIQHEMREGLVQLRMIGAGRPEIDLDSLIVTSYHTDPMLNLKDHSLPLPVTRGSNVFYERNDGDPPVDSILTAIHLKPLKQSTRKPTLLQIATKSTTQGSASTTSTTSTTTTTTTPHPVILSKSNNKNQKPLVNRFSHDDNGNNQQMSTTQHNRRYSNDHPNESLINRFAGRLRPSRPSLTTVRPVTGSTTTTTTTTTTTAAPITIKTTSTTPLTSTTTTTTTTTKSTTTSSTTISPPLFTTRKVRLTSTATKTTTTSTPEPPPIVYTDESIKLTSRDPNLFTRKTTRTRIDFPSLLAGLRSTTTTRKTTTTTPLPEPISSTISLGTVSPIPPNHKPPPGTSIKVTSLDFGQWRPLSPFKPPNQPKLPVKLTPSSSSHSAPSLSSSSFSSSQFTHLKPPPPSPQHLPSLNDYNVHLKNNNNRLGFKPGQLNKMPMVIAVSPGEHIKRRIPISVF